MTLGWGRALTVALLVHLGIAGDVSSSYIPLQPVVECVEVREDGSRVAHFSYLSRHDDAVRVPRGPRNIVNGAQDGTCLLYTSDAADE